MELKLISIVALLLFILSLQCNLSLGEESDSVGAAASHRNARQSYYYYDYSYYDYSYYDYNYYDYSYYDYNYYDYSYSYYYSGYSVGGWVYVLAIFGCCIICLPCIITAIVLCCCFAVAKKSNKTITTTTVTSGYTEFLNKDEPIESPQVGYLQPVQANVQYPPTQGYYPNTAPAGLVNPQDNPYPTEQTPPTYKATQDQIQSHGLGLQS